MKKSSKSHSIRQKSRLQPIQSRKHVYIYHWNRILGAVVVLLLFVGLTTYGLHSWFTPNSTQEELDTTEVKPKVEIAHLQQDSGGDQSEAAASISTLPHENTARVEELAVVPTEDLNPTLEASSEDVAPAPIADSTVQEANEETTPDDPESATALDSADDLVELLAEGEQPQPEPLITEPTASDPQEETPDSVEATPVAELTSEIFQLGEVEILTPQIKRFLLTGNVANKEPQGEISEIRFNAEGTAVIWSYSEVIDSSGSALQYVWLHDGSPVARVRVNVRGNRWRSYSSKIISQTMEGAWRVELQDGEGRLLASADFHL